MKTNKISWFLGVIALSLAGVLPAKATFNFSDFTFYRHNNPATEFHTTEYTNEDGTSAGQGVAAFQQFVHEEASAIDLDLLNARKLDATKLDIVADIEDLKIYFINEGAGYRNQLYLESTGTTQRAGTIFNNASVGDSSEELQLGDYVSFGEIKAGSTLDFALLANAYQSDSFYTYYAGKERNPDGIQHVMAYDYQEHYLILAWEDLYEGGDKDYNDIVFAIYLGEENLNEIPPEEDANDPPEAGDDGVNTPHNTAVLIDVLDNDSDPDEGDIITLTEVDDFLTEAGTVVIQGEQVLYTPNDGSSGVDTFDYTIIDSSGETDSATVTVSIGEAPETSLYPD